MTVYVHGVTFADGVLGGALCGVEIGGKQCTTDPAKVTCPDCIVKLSAKGFVCIRHTSNHDAFEAAHGKNWNMPQGHSWGAPGLPINCKNCLEELPSLVAPPPRPNAFHLKAMQVAQLVTEKQAAYGDSFGKSGRILTELYPNGISREGLPEALTVVRVLDKLFRIATANGRRDPMGENPWKDINGYSLLELARQEESSK